jgi:hypothetical protein
MIIKEWRLLTIAFRAPVFTTRIPLRLGTSAVNEMGAAEDVQEVVRRYFVVRLVRVKRSDVV